MAEHLAAEHHDTIVVGGGQTGLTVGYELKKKKREFLILDTATRVGDAWRKRWDSLVLFTPSRYNGLPGMPFPARSSSYIGKDDMADYLESYARLHELPIKSGARVEEITHDGEFLVRTTTGDFCSDHVVVAMADYQTPNVPDFAPDLDPNIVQLHSSQYKNPTQLQDGPVLVVGIGNSGADIGLEVAGSHETYVSGAIGDVIPFRIEPWFGRNIGVRLVRFALVELLNTSTPVGRRARRKMTENHTPLVRVKPKDLEGAGARFVPRTTAVHNGKPVVGEETVLDVANVIWCTGYRNGFDWIHIDVFDQSGRPKHRRGVVADQPGLYFCGLYFLHSVWSETITGMQRDARYVADHLDRAHRARSTMRAETAAVASD